MRQLSVCVEGELTGGLIVQAGKPTTMQEIEEECTNIFNMYVRLRALFTTLAFVSCDQPDFFEFETSELFLDKIMDWLMKRDWKGGKKPPLPFFARAWNETQSFFQSGVQSGATLNALTQQESSFQHFWTVYPTRGRCVERQ